MPTPKNVDDLTYNEALAELESILAGLRSESCDVDTLAERTAREPKASSKRSSPTSRTRSKADTS